MAAQLHSISGRELGWGTTITYVRHEVSKIAASPLLEPVQFDRQFLEQESMAFRHMGVT
jgi:hypothetical protein